MRREDLTRVALILSSETDFETVTGKSVTADSLQNAIDAVLNEYSGIEAAADFYEGFVEILKPVCQKGCSLEEALRMCIKYIAQEIVVAMPNDQNRVTAYVLATVASVKAVVDTVETIKPFSSRSEDVRDGQGDSRQVTVTSIIETVDFTMQRLDLSNVFGHMEPLPPHPTQSAIGFATSVHGIPSAVICYFSRKMFKEKLSAVNIVIYDEPPGSEELDATFKIVVGELSARYGEPMRQHLGFRAWIIRDYVLVADTTTGILGLRFGDPKVDPPSQAIIGRSR